MDRARAGLMLPEGPALLEIRHAVRAWSTQWTPARNSSTLPKQSVPTAVALSGGADSLALTAAAVVELPAVVALVVDHGLQPGSRDVAETAAERALALGCVDAKVLAVTVDRDGGMEAAARRSRYAALAAARGDCPVLIAHTLDDQAETVLLGLARGSGPRSIAGMTPWDPPWGRPLLGIRRAVTRQACVELGLDAYSDPQNFSDDFTRVRLRQEVLPLLEDVLGGGVAEALGRTATQLREDSGVLDAQADDLSASVGVDGGIDVAALAVVPSSVRRRVLRTWLLGRGARDLSDGQLRLVDDLIGNWRGQGGVAVAGGPAGARLVVGRRRGRLTLEQEWSLRT